MTENENVSKGDRSTGPVPEKISRGELMAKASELVNILHKRATATRFKESQHDRARLAYARAAVAAVQAYAAILKDGEMLDLEQRIAALEQLRGGGKV